MFNSESVLSKSEYITHFFKIAFILRPNIDKAELKQIVKDDYEFDNNNNA